MPIKCSSQNISIYQVFDDGNYIFRETFSGESTTNCQVLSNNTISLKILSSTFSQPNSKYYVKVDVNFVKQDSTLDTSEPLPGILKNKWTFFTGNFFLK